MGGSMGSFGCKLYLVVYYVSILACFIESNNVLYQVSFICLLYSVSFSIRFHAQCLFTMQISFSCYNTKPAPNILSDATRNVLISGSLLALPVSILFLA